MKHTLSTYPPQSLWNHGCCDATTPCIGHAVTAASISLESRVLRHADDCDELTDSHRLNLFGITGAATVSAQGVVGMVAAASISLESRVLRLIGIIFFLSGVARLNLFGITGAATGS